MSHRKKSLIVYRFGGLKTSLDARFKKKRSEFEDRIFFICEILKFSASRSANLRIANFLFSDSRGLSR